MTDNSHPMRAVNENDVRLQRLDLSAGLVVGPTQHFPAASSKLRTNAAIDGRQFVGNPVEMTIKQIAEAIITMTGSTSKIVYRPLPTDDPTQRRPDIKKAKQLLGWEPKVDLKTGLRLSLDHFRACVERGEQARV